MNQDSKTLNARCLYIKNMHHMIFFVLLYVDDCVYRYTSEALGKWFVDTLGKISHVEFLGFEHWFL